MVLHLPFKAARIQEGSYWPPNSIIMKIIIIIINYYYYYYYYYYARCTNRWDA